MNSRNAEQLVSSIARMSRQAVEREILNFHGAFKIDFTEEYLESLSLEKLRHILLAVQLHASARLN